VALVLVAIAIVAVALLDLEERGVAVVGPVDRAVPVPAIPVVPAGDLLALVPGVLAIVVIGFSESMSVARGFADRHHEEVRPDQELVALGMASIFGGVFQGFITGGGASQSAANDRAGARTQVASLVLAGLAFVSAIALLPLFRNLPLAVLGAIVIYAVLGFINIPALRRIHRLRRDSFVLACVAFVGVLILGILPGLLVTVALSILLLLGWLGRPAGQALGQVPGTSAWVSTARHDDAEPVPGLLIYRQDAPLLFVNASWLRDALRERVGEMREPPTVLVLDLEATADLDINGIDVLAAIVDEYARRDIAVWFAGVHGPVNAMLERGGVTGAGGGGTIHATVDDAVRAYRASSLVGGG
jgi:MFS superfamily sulfate permease-like transporter